jgi:hypothetical protein
MTARRSGRAPGARRWIRTSMLGLGLSVLACAALTGCGGSSKPGYCSDRANLESSIKGLTDLNASSGINGLKTQLGKIQTAVTSLVNSAKSDFPNETSAIKSSLDALTTTVNGLAANPSAAQIATAGKQASDFASSVQTFITSTSSKCG